MPGRMDFTRPRNNSRITTSVTLELVAATKRRNPPKPLQKPLQDLLSQPLRTACSLPGCKAQHRYRIPFVAENRPNEAWTVREDRSIALSADEVAAAARSPHDVVLRGFTVTSPTRYRDPLAGLQNGAGGSEPDHQAWFSPEEELRHVLSILNSGYQRESYKGFGILAIYPNASCGTKVNIGTGIISPGCTADTAKDILSFFITFERAIDSVHSTSRIRRGPMFASEWQSAIHFPYKSWPALLRLVGDLPLLYSSVGFALSRHNGEAHKTIEFKQQASTLDVDEIVAWIDVCETVVSWLDGITDPEVLRWYTFEKWFDLHYFFPQILREIGAKKETIKHYEAVLGPNGTYEELKYNKAVEESQSALLRNLSRHVATERYLASSRGAVDAKIMEKVMFGEYGWLPAGTPFGVPLPVFSVEDSYTYKTLAAAGMLLPDSEDSIEEDEKSLKSSADESGDSSTAGDTSLPTIFEESEEAGDVSMSEQSSLTSLAEGFEKNGNEGKKEDLTFASEASGEDEDFVSTVSSPSSYVTARSSKSS